MKRLLDTNVCVAYLKGEEPTLRDKILSFNPDNLILCSVVKAELLYGARKSKQVEENLQRLEIFFEAFESYYFDDQAADHYGQVRAQLHREGSPVGPNDLMIAAIALSRNLILVSRNQREFRRVVGLRVDVW